MVALHIEIQKLKGEKLLDKQQIEDLERRADLDTQQIKLMQRDGIRKFQEFKSRSMEEI